MRYLLVPILFLASCYEPTNVHPGMSYEKFLARCNVTIPEQGLAKTVETKDSKTLTIKLGIVPFMYGDVPPPNKDREPECMDATFVFINNKLDSISR